MQIKKKYPFWNSSVSSPSGKKMVALFDLNEFELSEPQSSTQYSPAGNGDVLETVDLQNIRVSDIIVSDILDSDHLQIMFNIRDHVKISNILEPVESLTNCHRFQSFASDLISPRFEINWQVEAQKSDAGLYSLCCFGI
jgi:hypothetical protein